MNYDQQPFGYPQFYPNRPPQVPYINNPQNSQPQIQYNAPNPLIMDNSMNNEVENKDSKD